MSEWAGPPDAAPVAGETVEDPSERPGMSDAEDDAWTELFETDAMRCCSCPSCNWYLPEGEYQPDSTCVVVAAVERIIIARAAPAVGREAADPLAAFEALREGARLGRRATLDPGAFVKRGRDGDGDYERLDRWQDRAIEAAIAAAREAETEASDV